MSEEKSYGQVMHAAVIFLQEENEKRFSRREEKLTQEQCDEIAAQAIIGEFLRRNGEPVCYVHPDYLKGSALAIECSPMRLSKEQIPLFAAPQPLPSVEEIHKILLYARKQGTIACGQACAIYELLKGKR